MKSRLLLALALAICGTQAAHAEPKYVLDPYVCNRGDLVPEIAGATFIQFPGRTGETLQLSLDGDTPEQIIPPKKPVTSSYIDFPGGYINNFKGNFQSLVFDVGPHTEKKDPHEGVINDARIGPHIVGTAHFPGQSAFIFDLAAKLGAVGKKDAQGFRQVTITAADLAGATSPDSPLPLGAFVDVMTITVSGCTPDHVPLTEDIDNVVINGIPVVPDLFNRGYTCPVLPPEGSGFSP